MGKFVKLFVMTFGLVLVATPVFAQEGAEIVPAIPKAVGVGLIVLGAALGIGRIGGNAVESMARQPEISGNIQTAMIIAAALIEGLGFFAILFA